MTEKEAQENPNSPAGWGVQEVVNPDTYPNGELLALEEQKRRDTASWEDQQNRSPMDLENPAQPAGIDVPAPTNGPIRGQGADALTASVEPQIVAKVFVSKTAGKVDGGKVLLGTSQADHQIGEVVAVKGDNFWVEWRDGANTVEAKNDYELIIRDEEAE